MKNLSLGLFACLLLSFSCEKKVADKSEQPAKETKIETVKKEIDATVDSLNSSWIDMMRNDSIKFKYIKRLLDEISYTSSYDVVAYDALVKKIDNVKAMRYDENLDTLAIDNYHAATDKLILEVFQLKAKTKNIEQHPLADELIEDITKANSAETISQKLSKYNWWANQYNSYLKKHKNKLEQLGEPYASLKEKPVLFKTNN